MENYFFAGTYITRGAQKTRINQSGISSRERYIFANSRQRV